jgi:dTDP-4-amino-4,6-dideoxygalactose transaminase
MKVPFIDLTRQYAALRSEMEPALSAVLAGGQYILGPEVRAFEAEFASYCGAAHGIGVASGTDALRLALEAIGIGPGDEVIVPPFTFVASAEVVTKLGGVPVFADIEPGRFGIDPAEVRRRLSPRTRAIMPVHLYGRCVDMAPLHEIADSAGVAIVEDAAQAVGAEYRGRRAGGMGRVACFSFFPTKNLGAYGDGGIVTTSDDEVAERLRMLRAHGSRQRYFHESSGWCSRLDELQAAALRLKLRHLEAWTERRRALAARYRSALAGLPLALPQDADDERAVYHLFTVRSARRDELKKHLDASGIGSAVHYPMPVHRQPLFRHVGASFPESERASDEVLSLPLFPELTDDELEAVVAAVRTFFSTR